MEGGLVKEKIQERGDVGLYDEEEEFLGGNLKERGTENGIGGIAPDPRSDQI